MLKLEMLELLQRYHDGEVSDEEKLEVEALLARDNDALEAMGLIDDMAEMIRDTDALQVASVSFDGFWDKVHDGIEVQAAADRKVAARTAPQTDSVGVFAWLKELFIGHKGAWITAAATAAAVAIVLVAIGDRNEPQIATVVEKHYIYVDSVNKADPLSTVVINSMQDEGSAVIWLLPNAEADTDPDANGNAAQPQDDQDNDDDIVIETEPL